MNWGNTKKIYKNYKEILISKIFWQISLEFGNLQIYND